MDRATGPLRPREPAPGLPLASGLPLAPGLPPTPLQSLVLLGLTETSPDPGLHQLGVHLGYVSHFSFHRNTVTWGQWPPTTARLAGFPLETVRPYLPRGPPVGVLGSRTLMCTPGEQIQPQHSRQGQGCAQGAPGRGAPPGPRLALSRQSRGQRRPSWARSLPCDQLSRPSRAVVPGWTPGHQTTGHRTSGHRTLRPTRDLARSCLVTWCLSSPARGLSAARGQHKS